MKVKFARKLIGYMTLLRYPILLAGILFASLFLATSIFTGDVTSVIISDGNSLYELTTTCDTVGEALAQAGLKLDDNDKLNCKLTDSLTAVDYVEITRPITIDVTVGNQTQTLVAYDGTLSDILAQNNIEISPDDIVTGGDINTEISDGDSIFVTRVEEKFHYDYETLGYEVKYVASNDMYAGEEKVLTEGVEGEKVYTFRVRLEDDVEVSREFIGEEVTKQPVTKVIAYGTKSTMETSRGTVAYSKVLDVVATAYTNDAKWGDSIAFSSMLGGLRTRWGVIAVDPSVIAPGTKVYVKSIDGLADYGFAIAGDTGGSIKGNRIDLWMDNDPLCNIWGVRSVEVYILDDQTVDVFELRNGATWSR